MKCTRPITMYFDKDGNRVGSNSANRDFSGSIFAKDVPCGKCLACRINRRREWTLRLCHEEVFSSSAFFVTLTYDEDHVPFDQYGNMAVSKEDVQAFMRRLRKQCPEKLRFFANSEYGPETGRPHVHMLLFNVPSEKMFEGAVRIKRKRSISFTCPWLQEIWRNGNVEFGIASKERAGYCAKYFIDRKEIDPILVPNFSLMSRRPGIGAAYSDEIEEKVRAYGLHACLNACGTYVGLPRYYRNRMYSKEELRDQFVSTLEDIPDQAYFSMLENADIVEQNRYRALHWKGKKSKI